MKLVTAREGARMAGVSYSGFRNWVQRGLLTSCGKQAVMTEGGHVRWVNVYAAADVLAAERATRERQNTWSRLARRVRAGHDDLMLG